MAMFRNVNLAPIDTSGFERAGAAYGQMFQNLGNTIADTIQKVEKKKEQKVASEAIQQDYGVSKEVADALARQDNILAYHQFTQQHQLAQRQQDEVEAMGQSRRALLAQELHEAKETFGDRSKLGKLAVDYKTGQIDSLSAQTDATRQETQFSKQMQPHLMAKTIAETANTESRTGLQDAQALNIMDEHSLKKEYLKLAQGKDNREQSYQNFRMGLDAQRLYLEQQMHALKEKDTKKRNELEQQRVNLLANQHAFDQMYRWQAQDLEERKFETGTEQWQKQFDSHKREFRQSMSLKREELEQAKRKVDSAVASGLVGDHLNAVKAEYYNALAQAGPSQSSSEFERSVTKGGFNEGEARELYRQRAMSLANVNQGMPLDKQVEALGKLPASGGVTVATVYGIMQSALAGEERNGKKVTYDPESKVLKFSDKNGRWATVKVTDEVQGLLDTYEEKMFEFSGNPAGGSMDSGLPSTDPGYDMEAAIDAAIGI